MSQYEIIVNADNHPVKVNINTGTPDSVKVTDQSAGSTSVVYSNPSVSVNVGLKPTVTVKYGISHQYDPTGVLALLQDAITREQLEATLISELDGYNSNISTLVNTTNLIQADLDIAEASLAVAEDAISSNVLAIEQTNQGLDAAVSSIDQNAEAIVSAVTRITTSENDISAAQSQIIQHANEILQLVSDLATANTSITQNADSIVAQATALNQTNNTLDQAVLDISANEVSISVLSTDLDNAEFTLGTTMEMLNNQYSVTIKQDGLGNDYVSGLKLIMYPDWDSDSVVYALDDYVWYNNSSWKCILGHTSDATNYPQAGAPGSTYWVEDAEGIKTSFSIQADQFKVQSVAGTAVATPFLINGTDVEFNASVKFSNYDTVRTDLNVADGATKNEFQGAWAVGHGTYYVNDTVNNGGVYYRCNTEHASDAGKEPPNVNYWDVISSYDRHTSDVTKIDGGLIFTGSILANAIGANQITADKINVDGAIDVGTSGVIRSGKTTYGSGTGWLLEYNGGTPRFDIGNTTTYMRWDGTELHFTGLLGGTLAGDILEESVSGQSLEGNSTVWVKKKAIIVGKGGTYRIKFNLRRFGVATPIAPVYGRLYVNGVATGTIRSKSDDVWTTYSEDIYIPPNGEIQLYLLGNVNFYDTAENNLLELYSATPATPHEVYNVM